MPDQPQTTIPSGVKRRDETWADVVERVMAEERERCARIAENWITEFGTFSSTGEAIAAKIREEP